MPIKPKLMLVDDDPGSLYLLYRFYQQEFQVFRADSCFKAMQILEQEGEMAVIIADQYMPEMKGTKFLAKTVEPFPDTIRTH